VFAACTPTAAPATTGPVTGGATTAPATQGTDPSGSPTDQASATPEATAYPDPGEQPPAPTADLTEYPNYGGEVDCEAGTFNGLPYTGNLKSITAPDPLTVEFEFCNPNVAFLSQVAFSALGIDDAQYLIDHMPADPVGSAATGATPPPLPEDTVLTDPNGTGPYRLDSWERGNRMTFTAFEDYWGEAARTPNLEFRWSDQAAQRFVELQAGTVDGIDNPSKDDLPAIEGSEDLALYPREGLNTFYLGFNNTIEPWDDVNVRKAIAMGIDRQRIVDNFYPPGSEVASHFTPCAIPFGCAGDSFDEAHPFNAEEAAQMLRDAGVAEGTAIKIQYRAAVRGYLPDPPTVAQEIASQLETNLGLDVEIEEQESGTFLDNNNAGQLEGIYLLGWGADYPDASNFLDYHFGSAAGVKFGDPIPELQEAVIAAGQTADEAERERLYGEANALINEHVPAVVMAHGGSGTAFKADVDGAFSSPLSTEIFSVMQAGDRDTLVWMQNAEPLSLYCADETDGETLRACEQVKESLYAYEIGGTETEPSLATECAPNDDLTVWTCTLREGITFHDGSEFDASDVILSYAAQWDSLSPLHVGRTGVFEYWSALVGGGFLNPPAPCGLPNSDPCEE
jgi:ABC-type transport system substrate-binding protein